MTKDYLLACGIAAAAALVFTFILWIFSLISWVIVWAVMILIIMPTAGKAIAFYQKHGYLDLQDFIEELQESKTESKKSSIES